MSAEIVKHPSGPNAEMIERVIIKGDLSQLNPAQRSEYYSQVCESLGLNPLTKPFDYLELPVKGGGKKLVLYAKKDCTDQLRTLKGVSVQIVGREQIGELYVVTARAVTGSGRADEAIGAVSLTDAYNGGPLRGEALANALMKAETKAKRRVTLSICGLGWLDEAEIEDVSYTQAPEPMAPHPQFAEPQPAKPSADAPTDGAGPVVVSVRVAKKGTSATKGDWTLFIVATSDGREFSTFSESVAAKAKELLASNTTVSIEAKEKDGKMNLIAIEAAK